MENDTFSFLIFGGHVLLLHLRQLSGLSGQYPALHPAFVRINFNSPANTFTFRGSYKHIPVHLQPKEKGLDLLYNLYPNSGIFRHNLLHIKNCFNSFHRNLANLNFTFLDENLGLRPLCSTIQLLANSTEHAFASPPFRGSLTVITGGAGNASRPSTAA